MSNEVRKAFVVKTTNIFAKAKNLFVVITTNIFNYIFNYET